MKKLFTCLLLLLNLSCLSTAVALSDPAAGEEQSVTTYTQGQDKNSQSVRVGEDLFFVVWSEYTDATDGYDIYGKFVTAAGDELVKKFRINTTTAEDQKSPRVVYFPKHDRCLVAWESVNTGVYTQMIDVDTSKTGNDLKIGDELRLDEATDFVRGNPDVDLVDDDTAVVVFYAMPQDAQAGDYTCIYGQRISYLASKVNTRFVVNKDWVDVQIYPVVSRLGTLNKALVVWYFYPYGSSTGEELYYQIIDNTGTSLLTNDTKLTTRTTDTAEDQKKPSAVGFDDAEDSHVAVFWEDNGVAADTFAIYANIIDSSGNMKFDEEVPITAETAGRQKYPTAKLLWENTIASGWEKDNTAGGTGYDALGLMLDYTLNKTSNEFDLHPAISGFQGRPTFAPIVDNSSFVSFYTNQTGSDYAVVNRPFCLDGLCAFNVNQDLTYTNGTVDFRNIMVMSNTSVATVDFNLFNTTAGTLSADTFGDATFTYNQTSGEGSATGETTFLNKLLETLHITPFWSGHDADLRVDVRVSNGVSEDIIGTIFVDGDNVAPQVATTGGTTSFTEVLEGSGAVVIDSGITITDDDDDDLQGATITITNVVSDEDILVFEDQNDITGSYDSLTGVLTLTGSDSLTNYQTALRSIQYNNSSSNPDTTIREISFVIDDGSVQSTAANKNVSITPTNDAPVINLNAGGSVSYVEGDGEKTVSPLLTISDAESDIISDGEITITSGGVENKDYLRFTNQFNIVGTYFPGNFSLMLTGDDTLANYQTAFRSVKYENINQNPSISDRMVSFVVDNSDAVTRTISVNAVNDAAIITTTASPLSYTEGDGEKVIDSAVTVTDWESDPITGGSVAITGNFVQGEDYLRFTTQNGIVGSYDNSTGILTLAGSTTIENYQAALQTVKYENTSQNPDTSNRTITFVINDGSADSDPATRTINMNPENDAPTVSTTGTNLSYTEGDGAVVIDSGVTASDFEDAPFAGATVSISNNFFAGQDFLRFEAQNGITGSYDDQSGVLTLTETASIANYQAALQSIKYENTSQNPNTSNRTISFVVNDGSVDSDPATRIIEITPTNNAPTVATTQTALSYTEGDGASVIDADVAVADVDVDVDSTAITGATVSIVGNFVQGQDFLRFSDQNGITGTYAGNTGVLTLEGEATLEFYEMALASVKYENTSENPDTNPRLVSFVVNDGTVNSVDSTSSRRSITITPTNDAAEVTTTADPLSYTEGDGEKVVDNAVAVFDHEGDTITGATISIIEGFVQGECYLRFTTQSGITGSYNDQTGILTLSEDATVAQYQAALRAVKYENTSQNPSTSARTVAFVVNDGTAGSAAATRVINVGSANNAPQLVATMAALSYNEGDGKVCADPDIAGSDSDNTNMASGKVYFVSGKSAGDSLSFENQNGITGSYDDGSGELQLTGGDSLVNYEAALRSVKFENTSDDPNTSTPRVIGFVLNDGTADSDVATRTISVIAVNDVPKVTMNQANYNYTAGEGQVALDNALTLTDKDNTALNEAVISIDGFVSGEDHLRFENQNGITGTFNDVTGELTLTGEATVAEYQLAIRTIKYENIANPVTAGNREISLVVSDASGTSVTKSRVFILNTAPVLTATSIDLKYIARSSAAEADLALVVGDGDGDAIQSAKAWISSGFVANEDTLVFVNKNGITGSYNSSTGELTLTGSASVADYQEALRSVLYGNSSDTPIVNSKVISFTVNDGKIDSDEVSRTINILLSEPTVVVDAGQGTYIGSEFLVSSSLTISGLTQSMLLIGAAVIIRDGFIVGEDVLDADGIPTSITASYNSETGVLTLTGVATVSEYEQALRLVTYENTNENPTEQNRIISFAIDDGTNLSDVGDRVISFSGGPAGPWWETWLPVAQIGAGVTTVVLGALTIRSKIKKAKFKKLTRELTTDMKNPLFSTAAAMTAVRAIPNMV